MFVLGTKRMIVHYFPAFKSGIWGPVGVNNLTFGSGILNTKGQFNKSKWYKEQENILFSSVFLEM
jgi:hypothetical protein